MMECTCSRLRFLSATSKLLPILRNHIRSGLRRQSKADRSVAPASSKQLTRSFLALLVNNLEPFQTESRRKTTRIRTASLSETKTPGTASHYLLAHNANAAVGEFQKLVEHRGIVLNFVTGALAYLQLGRACAMAGDTAKAKTAYQDFFALWKAADPDIPMLGQAKTEYANLRSKDPHGRFSKSVGKVGENRTVSNREGHKKDTVQFRGKPPRVIRGAPALLRQVLRLQSIHVEFALWIWPSERSAPLLSKLSHWRHFQLGRWTFADVVHTLGRPFIELRHQ